MPFIQRRTSLFDPLLLRFNLWCVPYVRTETRTTALNIPKARVERELEERISTSSADSTCKFPGYFRAASARILENTVTSEQNTARAKNEFLLTSAWFSSRYLRRLTDDSAARRREEKMGHGLSRNRSLPDTEVDRSFHVTEANLSLSALRASKVHLTIELLSCENENLENISSRKNNAISVKTSQYLGLSQDTYTRRNLEFILNFESW